MERHFEDLALFKGYLKHLATKPEQNKRQYPLQIPEEALLDPFQRDFITILRCRAFRRQSEKTQVYITPSNSLVRTRASHTNEVIANSAFVAQILELNIILCQAIAAGHDLGHAPYGHLGEDILTDIIQSKFRDRNLKFQHELFGVVLAQTIEGGKLGLNLTEQVLRGILHHGGIPVIPGNPAPPIEGDLVKIMDKISYTAADTHDTARINHPRAKEMRDQMADSGLGRSSSEIIRNCIFDLVTESADCKTLSFSETPSAVALKQMRQWMYKNIYLPLNEEREGQAFGLKSIERYFSRAAGFKEVNCNSITLLAILTDREAARLNLLISNPSLGAIRQEEFGFLEYVPFLAHRQIDYLNPGLDWTQ